MRLCAGKAEKRVVDITATATGRGYYLVTANGQVLPFGDATNYGDASESDLNNKIVAMSAVFPSSGNGPATGLQAVDDTAEGGEDAPLEIDVVGNDTAPSGGTLTLQSVNPPEHGQARVGVLAGRGRRRRLQLRAGGLPRLGGVGRAQQSDRGVRPYAHGRRVLDGGQRRRHLRLRRRPLPRVDGRQAPQPTDLRHGRRRRRQGLLAGGQ